MQEIKLHSGIVEAVKTGGTGKAMHYEVIAIARKLQANPFLYQVMEIAACVRTKGAIQQATDFLKEQAKQKQK